MKPMPAFALLLTLAFSAAAVDKPRVSRATLAGMEKGLDERITRLWDDSPYALLGTTRGVYLEGYGAVFTAELNLVNSMGVSPFHPTISKQDVERHHAKKLERLPQVKNLLRDALVSTAASLDTVPPDEQIVIVAFLLRYPWEDPTGIPVQIMMQGQRKKLLEARGAGASLDAAIRVTEY